VLNAPRAQFSEKEKYVFLIVFKASPTAWVASKCPGAFLCLSYSLFVSVSFCQRCIMRHLLSSVPCLLSPAPFNVWVPVICCRHFWLFISGHAQRETVFRTKKIGHFEAWRVGNANANGNGLESLFVLATCALKLIKYDTKIIWRSIDNGIILGLVSCDLLIGWDQPFSKFSYL